MNTPNETLTFYQKVKSVFDRLNNKLAVMSSEEFEIITAPLLVLYKNYYGSFSKTMRCREILRDSDRVRKELLPFLMRTLTELELEIKPSNLELHPEIKNVSEQLFVDGHYKDAVLNAFIFIENEIQKITKSQKIGKDLMDGTFSENNPQIKLSEDRGEQKGLMFLYSGSIMAFRNRYAHRSIKLTDRNYALDLLHFASALLRLIENPSIY